ncbi:hypothetical protein [Streptomyces sp. NPDC060065]|uniref:hypothetical protein n=1 Tax=Streptomyces sp. NPDC060065 TaxID=3347050 RepID=UPI00367E4D8D
MERDSIVGYLRGFIPWIASGVVSSFDLRWGALAGFLTGVFLLVQDLGRRVEADSLILEISSICYFAVVGVLAVLFPHSALETYQDAISFSWLALTAWGTLAIRRPFTLGIARRQTPPEVWNLPGFYQVNATITAAWGAGFTFIFAALLIAHFTEAPAWVGIAAHVVGLVAPMIFTSRYPARVQARMEAAAAAPAVS